MMIGLDTNILLRLGDDDDKAQRDRARALVRAQGEGGCYVNEIVLAELAWTLRASTSCRVTKSPDAWRLFSNHRNS